MTKVGSDSPAGHPVPGALRLMALQADLPTLTPSQQECVNKAKKYALELSLKLMSQKQATVSNNSQPTPQQQKILQRHQALVLMCRVYVGSISFELKEETIKAAFSICGAVKSINMSWDQVTMKHKGFAFVEYELPEAAQLALEHMNGVQLGGRQIKVGRPSNVPLAAPVIQEIQEECKQKNRIYISNVVPDLSEAELPELFEPFGKVISCKLALDPSSEEPVHRGYGYLEFETEAAAAEALGIDNQEIGGQKIHVCRATTPAESVSNFGTLDSTELCNRASLAAGGNQFEDDIQMQMDSEQGNLDGCTNEHRDDPEHSEDLNEHMSQQSEVVVSATYDGNSSASNIIVLRNMVTADDDLDDSLQLDVYEECSKYGQVLQVVLYVDKAKLSQDEELETDGVDQVKIFVKYSDSKGSVKAREALEGRFFGGRKVSAEHYDCVKFRLRDYSG